MASYAELKRLMIKGGLSERVLIALLDVANDVANESDSVPNHTNRYAWAASVFRDPHAREMQILGGVLIANKDASVEQIVGASDEAIKDAVADLVNLFAGIDVGE